MSLHDGRRHSRGLCRCDPPAHDLIHHIGRGRIHHCRWWVGEGRQFVMKLYVRFFLGLDDINRSSLAQMPGGVQRFLHSTRLPRTGVGFFQEVGKRERC